MSIKIDLTDIPAVADIVAGAEAEIRRQVGNNVKIILVRENYLVGVADLLEIVCKSLNISYMRMLTKDRCRTLSDARKIFFYLGKNRYGFSVVEMARVFSLHHASVLHGLKKANGFLEFDAAFRAKYTIVLNNLKSIDNG